MRFLLLLLRLLDRLPERGHQVDDLPLVLLGFRLGQPLSLGLRPDQAEQLLAVAIVVFLRLERVAQVLDEGRRHLDLGLLEPASAVDLLRLTNLVGVVHGLQQEHAFIGTERSEVLLVADDHLRDAHLPGLVERLDQKAIGLLCPLLRNEVVRLAEIDRVDLFERDEIADVDRVRELDVEPIEVLVLEWNEPALLDLEPADDLVGVDMLACVLAHLVVADRGQIVLVEEVELQLLGVDRRVHLHGNADQSERDRSAPDRSRHALLVPGNVESETSDEQEMFAFRAGGDT